MIDLRALREAPDQFRASQTARARRVRGEDDEPTLDGVRAKFGVSLSDEDLLLRAVMPAEQVDAMVRRRDAGRNSLNTLLEALGDDKRPYSVSIRGGGAAFSAGSERAGSAANA